MIVLIIMSNANILTVDDNVTFWIYTMNKKLWDEYTKSTDSSDDDSLFISSYDKTSIKKGDIIFYYVKDASNSGFTGISRVSSSHRKNVKHIKIFNDKNLNEHIIKLNYVTFFNNPIKIKPIFSVLLNENVAGHKSIETFRSKYMKRNIFFEKLTTNGYNLMTKLFEISDQHDNQDDYDQDDHDQNNDNQDNDNQNNDNQDDDNQDDDEYKQITIDNSDNDEHCISIEDDNEESPTYSNNSSLFIKNNSEDDNDNADDNINEGDDEGEIPILIVTCDEFKWPSSTKKCIDYFIDHYKKCRNCEISDNNNMQISRILDNADIEYYVCKKIKDAYFEIPLQYYHELLRHDPLDRKTSPFIRITRIENKHEIYHGCILITWIS